MVEFSPNSGGQVKCVGDDHIQGAPASFFVDGGRFFHDPPCAAAPIDEIIELWRQRQAWHRAEKSLTLQAKAICRRFTDGDKKEAEKLHDAAVKAMAAIDRLPDGHRRLAAIAIAPILHAQRPLIENRKMMENHLERLAEKLPVWDAFCKGIRGFGPKSLAALVGECGDLSNYDSAAKVWKRMGLAVIDGERQRRVPGEAALEHGYSPQRRAVAWTFGVNIVRSNGEGPYRAIYDARKAYEMERGLTPKHADNRARRYVTKRLLRDIWRAWPRA